jgi:hypothetical protein
MDLQEVGWWGMECILVDLAEVRERWLALVNAEPSGFIKCGELRVLD